MVDQCLADERLFDDNVLYPLFDNLGTIRDIADYDPQADEALVVNHLVYAGFGELVEQTNPEFGIIYGYTSQELDPESGLYDYDGRYYDPILAQFASQDPLGFAAGDVNLYRYVGNSPTNYNDPTGTVKAVYVAYTGWWFWWPSKLTWELEDVELEKITELEEIRDSHRAIADLLQENKKEFLAAGIDADDLDVLYISMIQVEGVAKKYIYDIKHYHPHPRPGKLEFRFDLILMPTKEKNHI